MPFYLGGAFGFYGGCASSSHRKKGFLLLGICPCSHFLVRKCVPFRPLSLVCPLGSQRSISPFFRFLELFLFEPLCIWFQSCCLFCHFCLEDQLPILFERLFAVLSLVFAIGFEICLQVTDGFFPFPQRPLLHEIIKSSQFIMVIFFELVLH